MVASVWNASVTLMVSPPAGFAAAIVVSLHPIAQTVNVLA
jgi:hypothetical protein